MSFPLVCDLAASGVPVAVACRVLGFSRQAFYVWDAAPVSQRDWDDASEQPHSSHATRLTLIS